MLPSAHRLKGRARFATVAKRGNAIRGGWMSVKYLANTLDVLRVGIVVSTQVDKRAVKRNLIRRRIAEALRKHLTEFPAGYDAMIVVYPEGKEKTYSEIENDVISAFNKIPKAQPGAAPLHRSGAPVAKNPVR